MADTVNNPITCYLADRLGTDSPSADDFKPYGEQRSENLILADRVSVGLTRRRLRGKAHHWQMRPLVEVA